MHQAALPGPSLSLFGRLLVALCAYCALGLASAQVPGYVAGTAGRAPERSVSEWLMRMHEASRRRSYAGTFVVSSATGGLSSARIW
ncbi:MAG: hypothetical protein LH617_09120, partial [Ramlibacter sp.]|nr:hypothetical protein [Ramlibacter sp.]